MFKAVGAVDEAAALWPGVIRRFPQFEVLHYNCALFLDFRGEFAQSERRCKSALVLKPDYLRAANQLGMLAARDDRMGDAIRYVDWPLRVDPTYANGHTNLGVFLRTAGAYGRAVDAFRRAEKFAENPQQAASGRFNAGMSKILIGEVEDGFHLLESRWATADFTSPKRNFRQQIWPGPYFKPDSSLLLYMEQGMGDEIMMSWYVPLLRRDTARLLVECDERLVELFSRTYEGSSSSRDRGGGHPATQDPRVQYKIPSFHVPQYYAPEVKFLIRDNWDWAQNRGSRFPSRLAIDPNRLERWRTWLDDRLPGRKRIAVSWRSKIRNRTRDTQYLSIEQVASAIPRGSAVVNLQYSSTAEEIAEFQALGQRLGSEFVTPPDVDLTNDLEGRARHPPGCRCRGHPLISLPGCRAPWVARPSCSASAAERVMWHQLGTPFIPWAPSLRVFFRHPSEDWAPTIVDLRTSLAGFLSARCRPGGSSLPVPALGGRAGCARPAGWSSEFPWCTCSLAEEQHPDAREPIDDGGVSSQSEFEAARARIVERLTSAAFASDPFDHREIDGIFADDVYAKLVEVMRAEQFVPVETVATTVGYQKRHVLQFDTHLRSSEPQQPRF